MKKARVNNCGGREWWHKHTKQASSRSLI